jgi:hypothetical protein
MSKVLNDSTRFSRKGPPSDDDDDDDDDDGVAMATLAVRSMDASSPVV